MGIIKRAGDLVYTFRFLKLLVTNFEDTEAYKLGIIDEKGKRLRKAETPEERNVYTPFHRLVFNIKKLIPGGKLGSYVSALYLIKEHYSVSEKTLLEGLKKLGVDELDMLVESNQWFVLEDKRLSPGSYKLNNVKVLSDSKEDIINKYDWVRVDEECYPVGQVFGVDVYQVKHTRTNHTVHVTVGELLR